MAAKVEVAIVPLINGPVVLAKPMTGMNDSGQAILSLIEILPGGRWRFRE